MEDKIPLDADHSMIVKFDNKNHRGHTSARDKLRQNHNTYELQMVKEEGDVCIDCIEIKKTPHSNFPTQVPRRALQRCPFILSKPKTGRGRNPHSFLVTIHGHLLNVVLVRQNRRPVFITEEERGQVVSV
jgi:hypothetical protein